MRRKARQIVPADKASASLPARSGLLALYEEPALTSLTKSGCLSCRDKVLVAAGYDAGKGHAGGVSSSLGTGSGRSSKSLLGKLDMPLLWTIVLVVAAALAAVKTQETASWKGTAEARKEGTADLIAQNDKNVAEMKSQYADLKANYDALLSQLVDMAKNPAIDPKVFAATVAELMKHVPRSTRAPSDASPDAASKASAK